MEILNLIKVTDYYSYVSPLIIYAFKLMIYTGILDATWKSLKENIGNESSKTLITLMH